MSKLSLL